jgi:hypothetical protein
VAHLGHGGENRAMRHANPHAALASQCISSGEAREGLERAVESGGLRPQRASALDPRDSAGRAIGNELRRRRL